MPCRQRQEGREGWEEGREGMGRRGGHEDKERRGVKE